MSIYSGGHNFESTFWKLYFLSVHTICVRLLRWTKLCVRWRHNLMSIYSGGQNSMTIYSDGHNFCRSVDTPLCPSIEVGTTLINFESIFWFTFHEKKKITHHPTFHTNYSRVEFTMVFVNAKNYQQSRNLYSISLFIRINVFGRERVFDSEVVFRK